jgi:hypothetical protein
MELQNQKQQRINLLQRKRRLDRWGFRNKLQLSKVGQCVRGLIRPPMVGLSPG